MRVTQQSGASSATTLSSGLTTMSGNPECDPDYSEAGYTFETSVSMGTLPGSQDGLGAGIQADATAFGTDTYAELSATATVSDRAVSASVSAMAAAQSSDGAAFASTYGVIDVYGGADVYLGITQNSTYTQADATGTTVVSQFDASVVALQFSADGLTQVNVDPDYPDTAVPPPAAGGPDCGCGDSYDDSFSGYHFDIDGNLAVFDVAACAFGDNTLVDVTVDA